MKDKIFLLSISEFQKYVPMKFRQCKMTKYDECFMWWWLRSSGGDSVFGKCTTMVSFDGSVNDFGYFANDENGAVRPAFQVTPLKYTELPKIKNGYVKYCGLECIKLTDNYNGNILLLSKYAIARRRFDDIDNNYENSLIRKFLLKWYEENSGCY